MKLNWTENSEYPGLWECRKEGDVTMLAWVNSRNAYCDRGHYEGHIEIGGIDYADFWPNYYMRLSIAMSEITDFLRWRIGKKRCTPREPRGSMLDQLVGPGMSAVLSLQNHAEHGHLSKEFVGEQANDIERAIDGMYKMIAEADGDPEPATLKMVKDLIQDKSNPDDPIGSANASGYNRAIKDVLELFKRPQIVCEEIEPDAAKA
jgi:hypothetical protein